MARRILLPDLYAAHSFGGYLEGVLAARRAAGLAGSLATLARSARVPYGRLRGSLVRRAPLLSDDVAALSKHLGHDLNDARYFALLLTHWQGPDALERRKALTGLVEVLEKRAERAGQGARFRVWYRWKHRYAIAGVRCGAVREAQDLATGLGIPLDEAKKILEDLRWLRPDQLPPDTATAGPDADLPTLLLVDTMIEVGKRSLARRPDDGGHEMSHSARSEAGAARRMHDLDAMHVAAGSPPTSPGLSRPVLLLTHTTLSAKLEP